MTTIPRVLLLGGNSVLCTSILETLHAAGVDLAGVVLHGYAGAPPPRVTPLAVRARPRPAGTARIAEALSIPVLYVNALADPETERRLGAFHADVLLSVCFPRRVPGRLRGLPVTACLNLHPSLLPAYRGPAPIFWQRRAAEAHTGVTLHALSAQLDGGPVLAQTETPLPDGATHKQIAGQLGLAGAALLLLTLPRLLAGEARYTQQVEALASYQPLPQAADFALDVGWPVRRAFNFMRATEHWCNPYPVELGGRVYLLARALGFSDAHAERAGSRSGEVIEVPFRDGTLFAESAPVS